MRIGINVVYEYDSVTPWEVWTVLYKELTKQSLLSEKYAVDVWRMKPEKIAERLESRNCRYLCISDDKIEIDSAHPRRKHTLVTLRTLVNGISIDLGAFVHLLAKLGKLKMAWVTDSDYRIWQNTESLTDYIDAGYPSRDLKMIPSGMPPPFDADEIDISNNPGRRIIHDEGYVEAIGNEMWIGEHLYPLTGAKKEDILKAPWLLETKDHGNYIYLKAAEEPFTDDTGDSRIIQDKLRALIFPNDVNK